MQTPHVVELQNVLYTELHVTYNVLNDYLMQTENLYLAIDWPVEIEIEYVEVVVVNVEMTPTVIMTETD